MPKRAIPEGEVTPLGIAGDDHNHPEIHGGPDQAVLLISSEAIAELTAQGFPLYPGALGENITTLGLDHKHWRSGQRWRIGPAVILEFTAVRQPCSQLSVYGPIQRAIYDVRVDEGDTSSPKWAISGFYARVLQPGIVRPGDPIALLGQTA
jgi:MOSC domain-containing protein YiiM